MFGRKARKAAAEHHARFLATMNAQWDEFEQTGDWAEAFGTVSSDDFDAAVLRMADAR